MNDKIVNTAYEIKLKNVIDMGLTFSALNRLFEKGSKPKITAKLNCELKKIDRIQSLEDFNAFHYNFCKWFTVSIRLAEKKRQGRIIKESKHTTYGQAAKLLDVVLKVYVYYASLPDTDTAGRLCPFLNTSIDNPILKHLKKTFPKEDIAAKTVEQIDREAYSKLQELIKREIQTEYSGLVLPTQYDDIMWNKLNR